MGEECFSIAAAEAYCMLEDLKEKFPKHYAEAKEEYDEVDANRAAVPSMEEIENKSFFPTDTIKDESARVGAKWVLYRMFGKLDY